MTGKELAPDSSRRPRAVVREVEGLKDCISLTCRLSCLSSPCKLSKPCLTVATQSHHDQHSTGAHCSAMVQRACSRGLDMFMMACCKYKHEPTRMMSI